MFTKYRAKTFEKQVHQSAFRINLIFLPFFVLYLFCYSNVSFNYMWQSALVAFAFCLFVMLLVIPFVNNLITQSISEKIEDWKVLPTDSLERTALVKDLYKIPKRISWEIFTAYIVGCAVFIAFSVTFNWFTKVNLYYAVSASLSVAIIAAIISWNTVEDICAFYAKLIVSQGIVVESCDKKGFGASLKMNFVILVIFPLLITLFNLSFIIFGGYLSSDSAFFHLTYDSDFEKVFKTASSLLIGFGFAIYSACLFFNFINSDIKSAEKGLSLITKYNTDSTQFVDCSFANELDYNSYLINNAILSFRDLLHRVINIASTVESSSKDLQNLWDTSLKTYSDHTTDINHIVSSIENLSNLSKNIAIKIASVTNVASKNYSIVEEGVEVINRNLENMDDIRKANDETLSVIKNLSEKIDNIWSIVKLIDGIADQTKIIALNAELEAANAGDFGKNFAVVAKEIRRLANDTIKATNDIRDKINEIQISSDRLILSSEDGTEKIYSGVELSNNLEDKFKVVRMSADITANSSEEIKSIIMQENESFDFISQLLDSIQKTMDEFSIAARTLTVSCTELASVSSQLTIVTEKSNASAVEEATLVEELD